MSSRDIGEPTRSVVANLDTRDLVVIILIGIPARKVRNCALRRLT